MPTLEQRITQFENMAGADPDNEMAHFSLGSVYLEAERLAARPGDAQDPRRVVEHGVARPVRGRHRRVEPATPGRHLERVAVGPDARPFALEGSRSAREAQDREAEPDQPSIRPACHSRASEDSRRDLP